MTMLEEDLNVYVKVSANPFHRDNPPSFIMTRGIAGSQVTLYGEWV